MCALDRFYCITTWFKCDLLCFICEDLTDCERKLAVAAEKIGVGHHTPSCDLNGDYSAVQSHASTGYHWCADPKTGKKIEGTDKRFTPPDCSKHMKGLFYSIRYQIA